MVFGAENSIVGVIFTIMMSASMVRDLTATPIKHLCVQGAVLVLMATAACFVSSASCPAGQPGDDISDSLYLYL